MHSAELSGARVPEATGLVVAKREPSNVKVARMSHVRFGFRLFSLLNIELNLAEGFEKGR